MRWHNCVTVGVGSDPNAMIRFYSGAARLDRKAAWLVLDRYVAETTVPTAMSRQSLTNAMIRDYE